MTTPQAPLVALASAFLSVPAPPADVRLVGEASDGTVSELPLGTLTVSSPRDLGVVLLRIEGLDPWRGEVAGAETCELRLANGDRLGGRIEGGEGEVLSLGLIGGVVLPVDIADFESLIFPGRLPDSRTDPITAPEEGDRIYRRTGTALDPVDGAVEAFTDEGVVFESLRVGRKTFPWGEIAALFVEVLESDGGGEGEGGAPVVVDLVDGSRVRGRMVGLSSSGLRLVVGGRSAVSFTLATVAEIALDDGSIAFLSELPPALEEGKGAPFGDEIGMTWPVRVDRSSHGRPLRAGGRVFHRGLGAHAPSRVTWELDGTWREMRGLVAIDDSILVDGREGAEGSVIFRIHVDGKEVWASSTVRGGMPPQPFPPISLSGAKVLTLEADMAADLSMGDRADWLRLLLVR